MNQAQTPVSPLFWQMMLCLDRREADSYDARMKLLRMLPLLLCVSIFSGCAGWQVGSPLPESIQSVSVVVVNKTDEPSIEVQINKSLRAELQMDGRLDIRTEEESDTVLKVTLTHYRLQPIAFDNRRGTLASEYRLTLSGRAVFCCAETGNVLQEVPILIGEAEVPYTGDLTSAKLSGLPKAADDLARKVVSQTVTVW
jgi:hypothetical protein